MCARIASLIHIFLPLTCHPSPVPLSCWLRPQGEPLHNYDPVLASIDILAEGLGLSRKKMVVSSVGLVPQIRAFLSTGKAKLALSLHATTDEVGRDGRERCGGGARGRKSLGTGDKTGGGRMQFSQNTSLSRSGDLAQVRDWIVPTNRRYPIRELVALLEEFYPMDETAKGDNVRRRVGFEDGGGEGVHGVGAD